DEPEREVWLVPVKSGRAAVVEEVAGFWQRGKVRVWDSVEEAWKAEGREPNPRGTLCAGSLYLVGEIKRLMSGARDEVRLNG
ncbi:MAG: hypothetical protein SNJ84_08995, partial [Verrucomicrobiia bacterium]